MAEKFGILGRKLGMTRVFADDGKVVSVTVIQAGPCPVTQVKTVATDGYNALQISFGESKAKHVSKAMQGHFAKAGTGLSRTLHEVRLEDEPQQKVGDVITCETLKRGDLLSVTGKTKGKGYQGRMRRWGFHGTHDTHGNEKVHRTSGSVGMNTHPGRVIKGKKMAGHWGNETMTQLNAFVVSVRPEDNVILVQGPVPGPKNGILFIRK